MSNSENDITNEDRAERCEMALSTYGHSPIGSQHLVHFIADALHWCTFHDVQFMELHRLATGLYLDELAREERE